MKVEPVAGVLCLTSTRTSEVLYGWGIGVQLDLQNLALVGFNSPSTRLGGSMQDEVKPDITKPENPKDSIGLMMLSRDYDRIQRISPERRKAMNTWWEELEERAMYAEGLSNGIHIEHEGQLFYGQFGNQEVNAGCVIAITSKDVKQFMVVQLGRSMTPELQEVTK